MGRTKQPRPEVLPASKRCSECREDKTLDTENFESQARSIDGFRHKCRVCRRKEYARWREANKENINARKRQERQNDIERAKADRKRYYHAHRAKERAAHRKYQIEHRAELSAMQIRRDRCFEAVEYGKEHSPAGFALVYIEYLGGTWRSAPIGQPLGRRESLVASFEPHLFAPGRWLVCQSPVLAPGLRRWPLCLARREARLSDQSTQKQQKEISQK